MKEKNVNFNWGGWKMGIGCNLSGGGREGKEVIHYGTGDGSKTVRRFGAGTIYGDPCIVRKDL